MSVTRVGATKKFSDNWDNIFGNGRSAAKKQPAATSEKPRKKQAAKVQARKPAKKKKAARK